MQRAGGIVPSVVVRADGTYGRKQYAFGTNGIRTVPVVTPLRCAFIRSSLCRSSREAIAMIQDDYKPTMNTHDAICRSARLLRSYREALETNSSSYLPSSDNILSLE